MTYTTQQLQNQLVAENLISPPDEARIAELTAALRAPAQFIISRKGRFGDLAGRDLYLTNIGLWSLDRDNAVKLSRQDAEDEVAVHTLHGLKVEEA